MTQEYTIDTTEELLKRLGDAAVTRRLQLGLSQEEVCMRAAINKSLLVRLEHGLLDVELSVLWRICKALEMDISQLVANLESRPC